MEQRALLLLFVAVTHVRAQQISNAPLDLGITAIVVGSVGIIIFLGVFSVLFFFRWYGRSKAETMDRGGAGPAGPTASPPDSGSPGQGPAAP